MFDTESEIISDIEIINDEPFIPNYLKGTYIDKYNQNPDNENDILYLPTRFNDTLSKFIKCTDNKLTINYIGPGQNDNQAESIATDYHVSPKVLLYYFEVDIIDQGESGYIGIGFSKKYESRLRILPGWRYGTMGYHGDDGLKFHGEGFGEEYGPLYSTGDTIGCCINFVDKQVFYTKNGINLGIAFEHQLKKDMFPIVGMRTRGECVEANFGMRPFKFDIDTYSKAFFARSKVIAQGEIMRELDLDILEYKLSWDDFYYREDNLFF